MAELVDAVDSKSTGLAHLGSTPSEATIIQRSPSHRSETIRRSEFDYHLPPELIAQAPLPERSASRLLLLEAARGCWRDAWVRELPELLEPGDLLILNDTRVLPARLRARKPTGARLELLLERPLAGRRALVQLRDSHAVRPGLVLESAGGPVAIVARCGEFWQVELPEDPLRFFERYGQVPLPPYIERVADQTDRERYQSLWARVPGAVAAPTASLHFDARLLGALAARGVESAFVTLHVGAGTFQPLRTELLESHVMHAERYEVPAETVSRVEQARAAGRRVVAVGTTVARALESAALESAAPGSAGPESGAAESGAVQTQLRAGAAETRLFIHPGFQFRVVDALLTNFHLPQSTLLMLVAAFAGRQLALEAYAHAVRERYRFFSYGDAMLVFPCEAARTVHEAGGLAAGAIRS